MPLVSRPTVVRLSSEYRPFSALVAAFGVLYLLQFATGAEVRAAHPYLPFFASEIRLFLA